MIKAIIWDFDGVIIDSVPKNQLSFKLMFEKYGKIYDREKLTHNTLKNVVELFNKTKPFNIKKSFEEFLEEIKEFTKGLMTKNDLIPDAIELIKKSKLLGIKNSIATNSTKERLDTILKDCEIENLFDFTISICEVENHKPHPEIIFKTLKFFNIKPQEAIFIEDNEKGIYSGINAGIKTVLYTNKDIKDDNIDMIVNNLKDIEIE